MADAPDFQVRTPIRCFEPQTLLGEPVICGAVAELQRPGVNGRYTFVCRQHQQLGDTPIAFPATIPRLSIVIEVVVAGVSWHPGIAKQEAVERLHQAVKAVGGLQNLHSVICQTGRYAPPPPDAAPNASQDRGR